MTRFLHSYTTHRQLSQIETLHNVIKLAQDYPNDELISKWMIQDTDYASFLTSNWRYDTLVNIEQDIAFRPEQIDSLLSCNEPLCCYPYRLDSGLWSLWHPIWELDWDGRSPAQYAQEHYKSPLPELSECSGLGLVKFGREIQNAIPLHEYNGHWSMLDSWISLQTDRLGYSWHVHNGPVVHNRNIAS